MIAPAGHRTLVSTDLLCEGIHFDLTYSPLKHLGYKAVVVNLSDICAMNGTPCQIVVGLGLSNRFSVEAVQELYEGVRLACSQYNVDLVGGDTTRSQSGFMLSVTAFGEAARNRRSPGGAKAGDSLWSAVSSAVLTWGCRSSNARSSSSRSPGRPARPHRPRGVARTPLKPEARTDAVEELAKLEVVP